MASGHRRTAKAATSKNVVLAVDVSGSTSHSSLYWGTVGRILESWGGSSFSGRVIMWDHKAWDVPLVTLQEHIRSLRGQGGTSPACIVSFVCGNGGQLGEDIHFVLLTDGMVCESDIDRLDSALTEHSGAFAPTQVTCHLIGGGANLSVSCPFTRNAPHKVYHHVGLEAEAEVVMSLTESDKAVLSALEDITTIEAFTEALPALTRAVTAKTLGTTGSSELKTRVLQLRKRLLADQGARAAHNSCVQQWSEALAAGDIAGAADAAGEMAKHFYFSANSWSKDVDQLVAMCDGALRGCMQPSRLQRGITQDAPAVVSETDGEQAAELKPEAVPFICPVTLDEENDAVLLIRAPDRPLLEALDDKAALDAMLNCPLAALRRQEFVKDILAHIDHPVSLAAVKASPQAFRTSPLTRAPLINSQIPGLCLSPHHEHAQATDHALALLLAGGKRPGNLDLWFAVVLLALESDSAPEYLQPLLPALRRQMQWRLKERKTAASLTGLADMVTTRVPLGVACWFVLAGANLPHINLHDTRDPLRPHVFHSDALCRLVELADFKLLDGTKQHITRLRTLTSLLATSKKDVNGLRSRLRALHQASVVVSRSHADRQPADANGTAGADRTTGGDADLLTISGAAATGDLDAVFVPIDGAASEAQAQRARASILAMCRMSGEAGEGGLTLTELAGLGAMVGPELALGAISLAGGWEAPAAPAVSWEWKTHTMEGYETQMKDVPVEICERTCRPFYAPGGRVWKEVAAEKLGMPAEELLSLSALYAKFVCGKGRYPESDGEFIGFVYEKVRRGAMKRSTLPCCVVELVRDTVKDFSGVRGKLSAEEFAKRFEESVEIVRRQEIEKVAGD